MYRDPAAPAKNLHSCQKCPFDEGLGDLDFVLGSTKAASINKLYNYVAFWGLMV